MPGEFSARSGRDPDIRVSTVATVAACACLLAACANIHETRERVLVSRRFLELDERPRPELDERRVQVGVSGSDAVIRLRHDARCVQVTSEEDLVEERIERRAGATAIVFESLTLAAGAWMLYLGWREPSHEQRRGRMWIGGVTVAVSGFALGTDLARAKDSTRRFVVRSPPQDEQIGPCRVRHPLPPQRVVLVLRDDSRLTATTDSDGRARIRIADELWEHWQNRIDVDVLVDDVPVRRAWLGREAP